MAQNFEVGGMSLELLDVGELALIHTSYKPIDPWLVDTFFPNRKAFPKDEVPIAELDIRADIAPLVSPHLPGKGFDPKSAAKVSSVKPAYLKPKNQLKPAEAWDIGLVAQLRDAGVIISGSNQLSTQDLYMVAQVEIMKRNRDSIDNRKILMAAEYLTKGFITLESEDYKRNVVSFDRDSAMTFTPAIPWDQTGATPVDDMETMLQIMIDNFAGNPRRALTTGKVWGYLSKNAQFKERFVAPHAGVDIPFKPTFNVSDAPEFKGWIGSIEIWTYDAAYYGEKGMTRLIPADYFAFISDDQGFVTQCRIENIEAGGIASDYFDSQWLQKDPSAIMLMSESAPLIVPSNKNGVCGGTGFITT